MGVNENDWEKPKKTCNNQNVKKISKVDLSINKFKALEEGGGNEVIDPECQECGNLEDTSISTDKSIKRKIRAGRVRRWKKMSNIDEVPAACVENIENEFNKAEAITTTMLRSKMRAGALQVATPKEMDEQKDRHRQKTKIEDNMLNPIRTIYPKGLNKISPDGVWEEIEVAVDSGATESVCPDDMPINVPTVEGAASRRGVMYEVANGQQIPNEGEKRFNAVTEEGAQKKMVLQVADVNQALLSVSKAMKAGNRVVFDEAGSYIESKRSGERTWMHEKNGMFIMKLWVKHPF